MNAVNIIGNLGSDPEIRYSQAGKAWTNLRLAVSDGYGDNKKTYWFNVIAFEKTAEVVGQYASKGSKLGISGRLVHREWEDNDGNRRQAVEIHAHNIDLLSSSGSSQGQGSGNQGSGQSRNQGSQQQQSGQQRNQSQSRGQSTQNQGNARNEPDNTYRPDSVGEDDIPF